MSTTIIRTNSAATGPASAGPVSASQPRRLALSLTLLALACAGYAGESEPAPVRGKEDAPAAVPMPATAAAPTPAPAPAPVDNEAQQKALLSQREVLASYHFDQGVKARDAGKLDVAIGHLAKASDYQPDNQQYRKLLNEVRAMAGTINDPGSLAGERAAGDLEVKQQMLSQEASALVDQGKKRLEAGEFLEAEQSFQMAEIRLQCLPFATPDRETRLRLASGLANEARQRRIKAEQVEQARKNRLAADRGRSLRDRAVVMEREQIAAMLTRAERARQRRDYDQAILLCEQVLKINRAEMRGSELLAQCRRERHAYLRQVTAERWDEEHKQLSERIRRDMIPQIEIVRFFSDPAVTASAGSQGTSGEDNEAEKPWVKAIENRLEQEISVDLEDRALEEVVDFLRKISAVNFILDPKVLAKTPPTVSLPKLNKMKLRFVLDFVMKQTNLRYSFRDEAIWISDAEGTKGGVVTKLYDIRDLTHTTPSFPGPELEMPEPGGAGAKPLPPLDSTPPVAANEFAEIIQKVVAVGSWTTPGVAAPSECQGSLSITHTPEVHKQVAELLRNLRNQRGKQIHISCKFLTIENSALEEIGVNWNNYTGNPRASGPNDGGMPLPGIGTSGGIPPNAGQPANIGGYFGDPGTQLLTAAALNSQLQPYSTSNSLPRPGPNDGMRFQTQWWNTKTNLYASAIITAVEKERRGNVIWEPSVTIYNGQQAHVLHMNQQAYIVDYDIVQGQYQPVVQTLNYGTVLDVQGIASADNKYITLTMRPTNSQVKQWRRFGSPIDPSNPFPGGATVSAGAAVALESPLLMPEMLYHAVRTSVTIPDGGSLVLAGMTNGESARSHSGIPFLSHIPFLGRLFSTNGRQDTELKTMIVVRGDLILFDEIENSL